MLKTCARCKTEKPVTDFREHKKTKDRLHTYCRKCNRILSKIARDKRTPEQVVRVKARVKIKNNTDEAKAKRAAYAKSDAAREKRKERDQSLEGRSALREYRQSSKGKAARRAYDNSDKGKATLDRMRVQALTPEGKADHAEASARYDKSKKGKEASARKRIKSALRIAARRAVNNSARFPGGLPHISTQTCSQCNKQAIQYHHHNGYEQEHWLDVIPVCVECHSKLDHDT